MFVKAILLSVKYYFYTFLGIPRPTTSSDQHGSGEGSGLQQGFGNSDEDTIEHIVRRVTEKIRPQLATSQWNIPLPTVVDSNTLPPFHYDVGIRKTDLNDKFDRKKLLSKIPGKWHKQAIELINKIEDRSLELSFNSEGIIFVDGEALPQSDAFKFFPLLFNRRIPKGLQSFDDFVTKLKSMGLDTLIFQNKHIKEKKDIDEKLGNGMSGMSQKNWWVLT